MYKSSSCKGSAGVNLGAVYAWVTIALNLSCAVEVDESLARRFGKGVKDEDPPDRMFQRQEKLSPHAHIQTTHP